jgi:hypothetical protein
MPQPEYHVQCKLQRDIVIDEIGNYTSEFQTSWIPEEYAHFGNRIKLKDENGEWEEGWFVYNADIEHKLESKYVNERSRDYKRTRKASDI